MRSPNHLLLYHRGFSFAEAFLFSPGRTGGLFPRLKTPKKQTDDIISSVCFFLMIRRENEKKFVCCGMNISYHQTLKFSIITIDEITKIDNMFLCNLHKKLHFVRTFQYLFNFFLYSLQYTHIIYYYF